MNPREIQAEMVEWGWPPSRSSHARSMAERRASGMVSPLTPLRFLVVEDEGLLALEIETYLERAGHTVTGIADTRTLALIQAGADRPDLALVDLRLHGIDSGLDLAADLGALEIPVLFVTGNCPERAGQGLALGCLHKPFDEGQLLAAVAIAGRLLHGEPVNIARLPSSLHLYG